MLRFETFAFCITLFLASVGNSNAGYHSEIKVDILDPGTLPDLSGAESLMRSGNRPNDYTVIYSAGIKDICNDR